MFADKTGRIASLGLAVVATLIFTEFLLCCVGVDGAVVNKRSIFQVCAPLFALAVIHSVFSSGGGNN